MNQMIFSSKRNNIKVPIFPEEHKKIVFKSGVKDNLYNIGHDEDFDTDEEIINKGKSNMLLIMKVNIERS